MCEKTVGIETEVTNMAVKIEGEYLKSKDLGWIKWADSNIIKITYDMNQRDNMYTVELKLGPFTISNNEKWCQVKEGINSFIKYIIEHKQVECGKDIVIDKKGEYTILIDKRVAKSKKAEEETLEFSFAGTDLKEAKLGNQFTIGYSLEDIMKREHELKDINKWFRMIPEFKETDKEDFVCSMIVSICCYSALCKICFRESDKKINDEYQAIFDSHSQHNPDSKNAWGILPRFTFDNIMQGLSAEKIQQRFNDFFSSDELVSRLITSYEGNIMLNRAMLNYDSEKAFLEAFSAVLGLYKQEVDECIKFRISDEKEEKLIDSKRERRKEQELNRMGKIKGGNLYAQKDGEFLFEYRMNTRELKIYDPNIKEDKDSSFFLSNLSEKK